MKISKIPFFLGKEVSVDSGIYTNDMHPVCIKVTSDSVDYMVRFHSEYNPNAILREQKALDCLYEAHGGWQPQIIECRNDGKREEQYLIKTFIPGKSLEKYGPEELRYHFSFLVQEISYYFINLRKVSSGQFHSFIGDDYSSYSDLLSTHAYKHIDAISKYDPNSGKHLSEGVEILRTKGYMMEDIIPTFIHYDVKPQNIIFEPKIPKITIIDYEHSRFGDPLHDLVRSRLRATENSKFYNNIWFDVEANMAGVFGKPCSTLDNIYQIYTLISYLPYFYKTNKQSRIDSTKHSILDCLHRL